METLVQNIMSITGGQIFMMLVGALLMYLGIKKRVRTNIISTNGIRYNFSKLPRDWGS